jgi:pre-mRNA-splicing factor ATP-dependent RNA helicase DHX15/PRP43
MNKNNGILDPEGKHINLLTGEKYSDKYKELAKIWSKLPAYKKANEIIKKIQDNQVILTIFETGAGKTVLNPKFALHAYNYDAKIIITLPKKIITKSAAEFAADTLDVKVGQEVGYQYRGSSPEMKSNKTKLLYATDGSVVARLLNDPELKDFDCVILDEAHDRRVQTDFLLYLLRETLKLRSEFKIIVMSATINAELFANYFREFKYSQIEVPGERTYPIKSNFLSKTITYNEIVNNGFDILINILETDDPTNSKVAHDVIFFVTSSNEAFNLCKKLHEYIIAEKENICKITCKGDVFCIEVYAGMSIEKQNLAQDKNAYKQNKYNRKVVIATNVAESSLTIDGIKYVIDTGYELSGSFDPTSRAKKLDRKLITNAQAKQRMGRAGRTEPGICYHMYTEEEFNHKMIKFPEPDIRTSDITLECLRLLDNDKIQSVEKLINILTDFIEPPREEYITTAINTLDSIGALKDNTISDYGKILNQIPENNILLAHTLAYGKIYNCSKEIMKINAVINITKGNMNDLYDLPILEDKERMKKLEQKMEKSRKKYIHKYGDHLTLLNIYTALKKQLKKNNRDKLFEWCYKNFYKVNVLLKIQPEYKKTKDQLKRIGRINPEIFNIPYYEEIKNLEVEERVLACYILGFQLNVAIKKDNFYDLESIKGKEHNIKIAKISTMAEKSPQKVIYNELFISMGNYQLTIVSRIPTKIIEIFK